MEEHDLLVKGEEIRAAIALQQLRKIRINTKKKLINSFGSSEAVVTASEEQFGRVLSKRVENKILISFDFTYAERAIEAHLRNHVRTIFSYRPDMVPQSFGFPVQVSERIADWRGSPLIWFEAGLPINYSMKFTGVMNPGPPDTINGEITADLNNLETADSSRIVVIRTGKADTILFKSLLAENRNPILIVPFGLDTMQLQRMSRIFPNIFKKASIISPYPAGMPAFRGCYHFRNQFFSQLIDSLVVLWGNMNPVQKIVLDKIIDQQKQIIGREHKDLKQDDLSEQDSEIVLQSQSREKSVFVDCKKERQFQQDDVLAVLMHNGKKI